jgi:hypothetical protein
VFRARFHSERGVRLDQPPCAAHGALLRHPSDYGPTQRLGSALREAGIDAFEYPSARDPDAGLNVTLFHPAPLVSRRPLGLSRWLCETRAGQVTFAPEAKPQLYRFALTDFTVDGRLPLPAA